MVETSPRKFHIPRKFLGERFQRSFEKPYISVLIGQRQIGKTTFIRDFLEDKFPDKNSFLYLNFDEIITREKIKKQGLLSFIESFFDERLENFSKKFDERKVVFIDEAQKLPTIFEEIKIIFDEYKHDDVIKFIVSGSSVLDLYARSAESLAGRIDIIKAFSFNFSEICDCLEIRKSKYNFIDCFSPELNLKMLLKKFSDKLAPKKDLDLDGVLKQAIIYGSLPDLVKLRKKPNFETESIEYIESYKNTYIEKDVRSLEKIGELSNFIKTFDALAAQTSNILVKSNLSGDLGISHEAFNNYLSVLENTFIIDLVRSFSPSIKKQVVKSPKLYFFDNSFVSYAHGFKSFAQLEAANLAGGYFENFVYQELKKLLSNQYPYLRINFYRTIHDAEIDFILDYKKKIIPIEVKWADDLNELKLSTLKNFINENPNCDYGIVIYNGEFDVDKNNRIIFLPAQYFSSMTY